MKCTVFDLFDIRSENKVIEFNIIISNISTELNFSLHCPFERFHGVENFLICSYGTCQVFLVLR